MSRILIAARDALILFGCLILFAGSLVLVSCFDVLMGWIAS